ncbi:MAG: DUF6916 family protein [Acidobacteriota bacterium]
MTALPTHPTFAEHLNTKFRLLRDGSDPLEMELIEVGEFNQTPNQEWFSIVFRGADEALLRQGVYPFEHDQMGEFELFIVPISRKADGYYYEAVFNRMRQ